MKKKPTTRSETVNCLTVAIVFLATLHGIIHLLAVCYMVRSPHWATFGSSTNGTLGLSVIEQINLIGGLLIAWSTVHLYLVFNETKRWAPRLAAVVLIFASVGTMQYGQYWKTGVNADRTNLLELREKIEKPQIVLSE